MEILKTNQDINLILNTETDFQTNLGWEENMQQYEDEVLSDIINPIVNYETVRYIHDEYNPCANIPAQSDIWFYFYCLLTFLPQRSLTAVTGEQRSRWITIFL